MAYALVHAAFPHYVKGWTTKFTLITIAQLTNEMTGQCTASIAELAEFSGLSRRTIQRCIQELEQLGFLMVRRGTGHHCSTYVVTLPDAAPNQGAMQ
jgi:DNA-binding transcriptional regulator YhcF (GntR family)